MKRIFTLFFVVSLLSATLWAEDVSVTETFGSIAQGSAVETDTWKGDICTWSTSYARHKSPNANGNDDYITRDDNKIYCVWMSATTSEQQGKIQTIDLEGGIKIVSFNWAQFGGEAGNTLKLKVSAGDTEHNPAVTRTGGSGANRTSGGEIYSHSFENKTNCQLTITNISEKDGNNACRILVGNIVITPYLLYTTKYVSIARGGGKFTNSNLIDNTADEEGSLSYSSSNTKVATIDSNGEVTPLAKGVTTITAMFKWDETHYVTTSYTLNIVGAVELKEDYTNAVKQGQKNEPITYTGNYYSWTYRKVRINTDKVNGEQAIWMSRYWDGAPNDKNCYIETASAEGGVKEISFNWQQANAGDNEKILCLDIKVNGTRVDGIEEEGREELRTSYQTYTQALNVKTNAKITLHNTSHIAESSEIANGRLLIGPIHITPYLFYSDKQAFTIVGSNYLHPIIDNTNEEGSISYALDPADSDKATIDASTGEVTATAVGVVTITATWSEGASTTYTLNIISSTNCETFSNEATASTYAANQEQADGDQCTWTTRLGGITSGDFYPYAAFIRAPRQNESKEAYLQSGVLTGGIASMTFNWNLVAGESTTTWDIRVLINGREVKRIENSDLTVASNNRMNHFEQITISDINEPNNFVIRFENHSTINGTYTSGNKGRFVMDNIAWTSYEGTKTLAEGTYNDGWIRSNDGEIRNVMISRSELQGGKWNTLCLPFTLAKSALGEGASVQEMTSASKDGEELTIGFSAIDGDVLTAGKPYLVKPVSNIDISGIYEGQTIAIIGTPVAQEIITLHGIYSPTQLIANDYSILFVGEPDGAGNNLYYPSVNGELKGFRAYFKISDDEGAGAPIRRARFVTDQEDTTTGIGQTLQSAGATKRMEDGQLVIIRDGVRYDIFGRKL